MADAEKKPGAPRKRAPTKTLKVAEDSTVKTTTLPPKKAPIKKTPAKEKPAVDPKIERDKIAEKVEQSKKLGELIKKLGDKNTPGSEKEATKLAKDTIKLVTEAQKSGSLSFKRESTKALVQIRSAVDKMAYAKDAQKDKLISDIDGVVLDTKNATLYMTSMAKAQVEIIREKGKAEAKKIKEDARASARKTTADSKANAKRIGAQADLEAQALAEKTANELKVQRAEQVLKIRRIRQDLADRSKKQAEDAALREESHKKQMDDDKAQAKKDAADKIIRVKQLKDDLLARRAKQDIENKERILLLRQKEKDLLLDYRTRRQEANEKVSQLHREIRESNTSEKGKKTHSDAKGFLGKVGAGIADANPLLALAHTITKGMMDTGKMLLEKKKDKRSEQDDHSRIHRIFTPPGQSSRLPRPAGGPTPRPPSNAPQATPRAGTVAPTTGTPNTPDAGGPAGGLMGLFGKLSPLLSAVSSVAKVLSPILGACMKAIPGVALFALAVNGVLDFVSGFNNASKLFTDDMNPSFVKKVFAGLTNVGASLLSVVDHIAGWMGFDLDLKGAFQEGAKKLYKGVSDLSDKLLEGATSLMNTVLIPYRYVAGKFADLLMKLPFVDENNAAVKMLKGFSNGGKITNTANISNAKPAVAPTVAAKKAEVANLQDNVDAKKQTGSNTAVVDNSVKTNSTTIVSHRLSTRTSEKGVGRAGYGSLGM